MSVVKSVVRSVMSSAVQSVMGISRRYIHTLDSAGGMYYAFSSNIAPAGDWSFTYVGTLESANNVIFGETAAANNRIVIQSTGNVQIAFGGTSSDLTSAEALSYLDGKIHTVSGSISGTTVTLKIDGSTIGAPTNAGSPSFATVGRSNTVYSDGSPLSLKIWDAGTLVGDYDFNTDLSNSIVRNKAAVLGSELWAGTVTTSANVSEAGGVISFSGVDTSYIYARVNATITAGKTYLITLHGSNHVSGSVKVQAQTTSEVFDVASELAGNGTVVFMHTAVNNNTKLEVFRKSGEIADMDVTVSVREIPAATPYLTATNMTSADSELFQLTVNKWVALDGSPILEYA